MYFKLENIIIILYNISMEDEMKHTAALLGAAAKAIGYIALAVALLLWGTSYKLSSSTIQSCKEACDATESRMESVTSRECMCEYKGTESKTPSDLWVLPQGMKSGLPRK